MSDAATTRRSHTARSAIRAAATVWFPLVGGIAAWAVHLVFLAAFVRYSCNAPGSAWAMHAVTAATVMVTVAALVLARRLGRDVTTDDDDVVGERFLGQLALLVGAISLLLIVVEEIYVIAFHASSCG